VRKPCGDGPGECTGAAGKQIHTAMRYMYYLVQVGNSGNTWCQMETRREVAHLDPLLTGGFHEAHCTPHPSSDEAGCLAPSPRREV